MYLHGAVLQYMQPCLLCLASSLFLEQETNNDLVKEVRAVPGQI